MSNNKRVCLPISGACNSNCIFCMDDWNLSKFITMEDVKKKLHSARLYGDEITFSSLEPTLHPKLAEIVSIAKEMGFSRIEIVTNGRRLKDIEFAEKIIQAGINEVDISIHSYIAEKHDFIVQSKNAFVEGVAGLINTCKLSQKYPITVSISVTVCKQNYADIYKIVYFLEKFSPKNIILNILQPRHAAKENKNLTFVKYSLMVKEFLKLKDIQNKHKNIYINGLVPCLATELGDSIGYFNGAQINRQDTEGEYLVDFNTFKEKREECRECAYNSSCDGVWGSYINKFGWDEFLPVKKNLQ